MILIKICRKTFEEKCKALFLSIFKLLKICHIVGCLCVDIKFLALIIIFLYNTYMSNYFLEKSRFYYDNYIKGKLTQKVSAIIRNGDKFLALINQNGRPYSVGGSVEPGEKAKNAIIREIKEEICAEVSKIKYLTKIYYQVEWEYNGIKFPNKRVEYIYVAELKDNNVYLKGLKDEFSINEKAGWFTLQELVDLNSSKKSIELFKKSQGVKL